MPIKASSGDRGEPSRVLRICPRPRPLAIRRVCRGAAKARGRCAGRTRACGSTSRLTNGPELRHGLRVGRLVGHRGGDRRRRTTTGRHAPSRTTGRRRGDPLRGDRALAIEPPEGLRNRMTAWRGGTLAACPTTRETRRKPDADRPERRRRPAARDRSGCATSPRSPGDPRHVSRVLKTTTACRSGRNRGGSTWRPGS